MILIFMTTFLSGCVSGVETEETANAPDAEEADIAEPQASAAPAPIVTPEPVEYVSPLSYEYNKEISSNLDIGMKYPSHWIKETGTHTLVYKQPVNEGELAARVALTSKKVPGIPDNEKMAELIGEFTDVISKQYDEDFRAGELMQDIEFIKRPAFSRTYSGTYNGVPVKGFIIITCNTKKKRLYVMHFTAPASNYDEMDVVLKLLVSNVVILSK